MRRMTFAGPAAEFVDCRDARCARGAAVTGYRHRIHRGSAPGIPVPMAAFLGRALASTASTVTAQGV
ncbi:hypothetical protein AB5L52_23215 [Streptomyces sp. CG4]|uniref:hypothetical protein n=1 Tax=Streptomyces sp. CG4 TaxID=408783 RepID=UPI0034E2DD11